MLNPLQVEELKEIRQRLWSLHREVDKGSTAQRESETDAERALLHLASDSVSRLLGIVERREKEGA